MRLIDAENFSESMKDYFTDMIINRKYNVDCVNCNADLQHLLDNQPTTYDVEKVVEELKENASRYTKKYTTPYGNNGYRDTKAISIRKAIEIVKQGGVSDDVCEWKKSKDYPYDWLVGCDGCEVNHRQGDYCPRCGKKIRIVGD